MHSTWCCLTVVVNSQQSGVICQTIPARLSHPPQYLYNGAVEVSLLLCAGLSSPARRQHQPVQAGEGGGGGGGGVPPAVQSRPSQPPCPHRLHHLSRVANLGTSEVEQDGGVLEAG